MVNRLIDVAGPLVRWLMKFTIVQYAAAALFLLLPSNNDGNFSKNDRRLI